VAQGRELRSGGKPISPFPKVTTAAVSDGLTLKIHVANVRLSKVISQDIESEDSELHSDANWSSNVRVSTPNALSPFKSTPRCAEPGDLPQSRAAFDFDQSYDSIQDTLEDVDYDMDVPIDHHRDQVYDEDEVDNDGQDETIGTPSKETVLHKEHGHNTAVE
jgi:hypothetical protein